jgi:Asp-tRNA(Asn)/Glu-tRNA(Gln) amidotransferase A subunit family amidase
VTPKAKPVLGIPDGAYLAQTSPEGLTAFESQCRRLQHAGYVVRRIPTLANIEAIIQRHTWMISYEMAQVHKEWFPKHESLYRPHTARIFRDGKKVTSQQLNAGRNGILQLRDEMETLMKKEGIDLWICPSALGPAPEGIGSTGNAAMSWPWTHSGIPSLSLPAGSFANGLPSGIQFVAGFMDDERLLAWARDLEKVFG